MPSQHATAHSPNPAGAARMRAIGLHRRRPAPRRGPSFLCSRCCTSWTGAEADCYWCGLPATQEHSHPSTALQVLLIAVGRTPVYKTEPGQQEQYR